MEIFQFCVVSFLICPSDSLSCNNKHLTSIFSNLLSSTLMGFKNKKNLKHFATWFNILAFKQCDLKQWVLKPNNWHIKHNSPMSVHHNCDTLPMSDANAIQGKKSLANIFKVIQGYWSVTVVSIGLFWLYFVSFSYNGVCFLRFISNRTLSQFTHFKKRYG